MKQKLWCLQFKKASKR